MGNPYAEKLVDDYMRTAGPELQELLPDLLVAVHDLWFSPAHPETAADIRQRLSDTINKVQKAVVDAQERRNVDGENPAVKQDRLRLANRDKLIRFLGEFFQFEPDAIRPYTAIVNLLHHNTILKQEQFQEELDTEFDCHGILDTWRIGDTLTVDRLLDKVVYRLMEETDEENDEQTD